ncbi:MAG: hypothetical protein AVDCRST_MAG42-2641 [uncultured Chthoniobacterales bacterium]|uniref:Uncharacterized protein n=1 Tax=uncultured Chthoniobacterales bacterium TaxID=1836801 RepID=A0A6J4IU32_9BACT|nr:MAG: hypothetical protein AVDCRST_MAG42-2641 [uncultured Chthoniobacterales bacterium]
MVASGDNSIETAQPPTDNRRCAYPGLSAYSRPQADRRFQTEAVCTPCFASQTSSAARSSATERENFSRRAVFETPAVSAIPFSLRRARRACSLFRACSAIFCSLCYQSQPSREAERRSGSAFHGSTCTVDLGGREIFAGGAAAEVRACAEFSSHARHAIQESLRPTRVGEDGCCMGPLLRPSSRTRNTPLGVVG